MPLHDCHKTWRYLRNYQRGGLTCNANVLYAREEKEEGPKEGLEEVGRTPTEREMARAGAEGRKVKGRW